MCHYVVTSLRTGCLRVSPWFSDLDAAEDYAEWLTELGHYAVGVTSAAPVASGGAGKIR